MKPPSSCPRAVRTEGEAERDRTWYVGIMKEGTREEARRSTSRVCWIGRVATNLDPHVSLRVRHSGTGRWQATEQIRGRLRRVGEGRVGEREKRNPKGPIPREPCFTTQAYDGSGKQERGTCAVLLANLEGW